MARTGRGDGRKRVQGIEAIAPTEKDIAYFSGLLDGEGALMLCRNGVRGPYGRRTRFVIAVRIGMTTIEPLRWAAERFPGGRLYNNYTQAVSDRYGPRKAIHRLDWSDVPAVALLELVLPYLQVKWKQAQILIDMGKLRRLDRRWRKPYQLVHEEIYAVYEGLHLIMKELNLRGGVLAPTEG